MLRAKRGFGSFSSVVFAICFAAHPFGGFRRGLAGLTNL
jgi:hypothetical protein